jgi:hypothetical protein
MRRRNSNKFCFVNACYQLHALMWVKRLVSSSLICVYAKQRLIIKIKLFRKKNPSVYSTKPTCALFIDVFINC